MISQDEQNSKEASLQKASSRKDVIAALYLDKSEDNWQNVPTPYDIAGEMVDLASDATHYVVLFSIEFLEVLVKERGVDPSHIIFFADTDREMKVARHAATYGVTSFRLYKNRILTPMGFDGDKLVQTINEGIKSTWGDLDMKFNKLAVVMNPPYQSDNDKGGGVTTHSSPLYQKFIEAIIDKTKTHYVVSINPSRWMVGGRGLDRFRDRMLNDKRIRNIVHFSNPREVFPSVGIAGGVSYMLWDRSYDGVCFFSDRLSTDQRKLDEFDIVILDNSAIPIVRKVVTQSPSFMNKHFSIQSPFGIKTSFSKWDNTGILCYAKGRTPHFCNIKDYKDKFNIIDKWKVCTGKTTSEGNITSDSSGKISVASNFFLIEPGAICTQTYIVVNVFDGKAEADNFISYMKTKFFRFMLGLRISGVDINKDKLAFVPDLGDYSRPWNDQELYDKFNLTRQERAYIESKIKPLKGD